MFSQALLFSVLPLTHAAETVLGVYMFHRHGDRTSKSTLPTNLTSLGYQEVFESGTYYRNQYVASGASLQIAGVSPDIVNLNQISVSAPLDTVLMPSAMGFLQGLYPPVGTTNFNEQLHNGTNVSNPLGGFQLIPIQQATTGTGSENTAWLQGSSNCANAIVSSNNYFTSAEYMALLNSTESFYKGLSPMINGTFNDSQTSFKNAYTIYDLLNVASIDNVTFPSQDLLTPSTFFQLRTLADNHEFNLAFNSSDSIRAIAGATLAAQIVQGLNTTITSKGKTKITIQFGAYGSFQSFFGLANLTSTNPDFYGVPDYASNMIFELYTDGSASPFPSSTDDLRVRFLFHNGTTNSSSPPVAYPLFGSSQQNMSWADFTSGMNKFAIGDQASWCTACGNTTGVCASSVTNSSGSGGSGSSSGSSGGSSDSGNGLSPAVNGVIGAMVTLGVILGLEALILLSGGYRLVSKKRLAPQTAVNGNGAATKA